jgi:hypothetical protein
MTKRRHMLVRILAIALLAALTTFARSSSAQERRIETAAKEAIKRARVDFSAGDFDGALARLLRASRACGTIRCSVPTRAALLRDEGVMQLRRGEAGKAAALFTEALRTDRRLELPEAFDQPDIRAAWDAASGVGVVQVAPPPAGDFVHTPPSEQTVSTPVPIYVEYKGADHIATVAVKYQSPGDSTWKRVTLAPMSGGWGGTIPCADVKLGTLRYYVQGFDSGGSPNALSGDPKRPFSVSIRASITGSPPSLPGQSPPVACTGAAAAEAEASQCIDDSQCNGGSCLNGRCAEPTPQEETKRGFARLWVGFSASLDVVPLPSGKDVCALNSNATPYNGQGYTCTNPNGSDFPSRTSAAENATLTTGNAGQVNGGPAVGDVRLLVNLDYALSSQFLLGVRGGSVVHGGAGAAAYTGKGLEPPFHFETRATYLFAADALSHSGFAPLAFVDVGVAHFDAARTVSVTQTDIPGALEKNAWRIGGPFFFGGGAGVRYAFSQRIAFTMNAKLAFAVGGGLFPTVGPEVALAYGF